MELAGRERLLVERRKGSGVIGRGQSAWIPLRALRPE